MSDDEDGTGDEARVTDLSVIFNSGGDIRVNGTSGTVVQSGGVQNFYLDAPAAEAVPPEAEDPREGFLAAFRQQALTQAGNTFRLSMFFVSAGSVILLCGAALVLLRHGSAAGSTAGLMTGLSGVLISTCGGAFALHANRARKHLTEQADRVSEELRSDHTLDQALTLIDRIEDPVLRDRLRSITAMRALGLAPTPEDAANRVLPAHGIKTPEIEPKPPTT
ncbi:hypothetical protein LN042_19985 [Kitasatospora sp. RB6PN24]|uniref:TRADD-N-associated membrane domain-containing protein n=1 Tax=Kitasatospora humi TaxID=2893891 RepID=UPI001E5412EB|nr:hypothetical protein [Kitasatospora humi]MCC9309333.1 hypothetical protein [Kitasatospora humi]